MKEEKMVYPDNITFLCIKWVTGCTLNEHLKVIVNVTYSYSYTYMYNE